MPHILFLMSDTGGGHRAAAEALMGAIKALDDERRMTLSIVDFLTKTAPAPLNNIGCLYRPVVNYVPWLWSAGYAITSTSPVCTLLTATLYRLTAGRMRQVLEHHAADLIVSVHPLATTIPARVIPRMRPTPPFIVVVTDLATAHPFWFTAAADHYFVPSDHVRRLARQAGLEPARITVSGLPINPQFGRPCAPKARLKATFGLPPDRPLVLLMGGGEGMGPLAKQAKTIATSGIPLTLMVIAGRNEALYKKLSHTTWPIPVVITRFVRDMPRRMRAADVIVTKAGPGTLSEALAAHQPILVTDYIPGQETGNVTWVVEGGAGRYVPTLPALQAALHDLFDREGRPTPTYHAMTTAAGKLAQPEAATTIAERLVTLVT